MENDLIKICFKCGETKLLSEFYNTKNSCKKCDYKRNREWIKKHPDIRKVYRDDWNKKHPERKKSYHFNHGKEDIERSKQWIEDFKKIYGISYWKWYYKNNKEQCKLRNRRNAQKPESKKYQKDYRLEHREELNDYKRRWNRKYYLEWGYYPGQKKLYLLGTSWLPEHRKTDFEKEQIAIQYEKKRLGLFDNPRKWTFQYIKKVFNHGYFCPPSPIYSNDDLIELGDF